MAGPIFTVNLTKVNTIPKKTTENSKGVTSFGRDSCLVDEGGR